MERIIDFHTYVGQPLFGYGCTPDELRASMEEAGIARSVICPVKTTDAFFEEQNLYIAMLAQKHPDAFIGFARVDPHLGDYSRNLLRRCVLEYGLRGLLLHPWEETFAINDEKVFPLLTICAELSIPVMVEAGYPWLSHCFQIGDLAGRFPQVPIIMTGGGQMDSAGFNAADVDFIMAKHQNLIISTGGEFSDESIECKPVRLGPGRVLFGSHSPYLNVGLELFRVRRATLTDAQRQDIFWETAHKLLGLEG